MTTHPEEARYEVPGTTLPQSPLLLLSDRLDGFELSLGEVDGYDGEVWGVVRLMVDDAAERGLSSALMGWGQTPGEALTSAGLRLLWRAEQDGVPLSPTEQALLLSAAPLTAEGIEAQAAVQAVFDRLDALLRAALELGVDGQQLLAGIVAVLQDAGGLPTDPQEDADASTDATGVAGRGALEAADASGDPDSSDGTDADDDSADGLVTPELPEAGSLALLLAASAASSEE